jgi:3-deoxy-D-manno-octulosonic acid kinase
MNLEQRDHQTIWYSPESLAGMNVDKLEQLFDPAFWQSQNLVTGSATGRGTTWFVRLPSGQAALRHYYRGGLLGKCIKDSYLFLGWAKTRCAQELMLLTHLHKHKVNVPKAIAARATKHGLFYRSDILTAKVEEASDLVDVLQSAALSEQQYHNIGAQIALMHKANVDHTDLNIHNLLLDANDVVWIIDFDKCRQREGSYKWKAANLDRLKRSFNKEVAKRGIHWSHKDWQALMDGYTNG